jgi:uncharacterized protein YuzE
MTTTSVTNAMRVHEAQGVRVTYYPDDDAAYVCLAEGEYCFTAELDEDQRLDYSTDGRILGFDLMKVSRGVPLRALPRREAVKEVLEAVGIATRLD